MAIPNTTPTPNELYNGEMKKMNETELKVVLLVTRKTLGWYNPETKERKNQDFISQKQFIEFTGKSHTAISTAIQSCVEHGWIVAKIKKNILANTPELRRRNKVYYQLGSVFINKLSTQESCQDENLSNFSSKSTQLIGKSTQESGQYKRNYTKETKQKVCFILKDWNERQSSPIMGFKPENIVRKYGAAKIDALINKYGRQDGGFSRFLAAIKKSNGNE